MRKQSIPAALLALVLLAGLSACGANAAPPAETPLPVAVPEVQTQPPAPEETPAETPDPTAAYHAAVDAVLREYAALDRYAPANYDEDAHPELPWYTAFCANPVRSALYYGFYDFDGNGTEELLIAAGDDAWQEPVGVYAFDGEKMVYLCKDRPLGDRVTFSAFEDGLLGVQSFGGAASTRVTLYRIAPDGYSTELVSTSLYDPYLSDYIVESGDMTVEQLRAGNYLRGFDTAIDWTLFAERTGPEPASGHYTFQPKVSSAYMEEIYDERMVRTWNNLVDAVMAGEDSFECPDQWAYDWVFGQFPDRYFPVLTELIESNYAGAVQNGIATFQYLVSKEECKARIEEFAALCEGILNGTLEDDYTDLEKALALYRYFTATYEYDYDSYYKMYEEPVQGLCAYRLMTTGTGICCEISAAYSYLLMQAGVDATIMMGDDHQWSYVRINGNNYHVDPTFGLGDPCDLQYFMMTDEKRSEWYTPDTYVLAGVYTQEYGAPDYKADDDTFAPLWDSYLDCFDHKGHTIYSYAYAYDDWFDMNYRAFDYEGF